MLLAIDGFVVMSSEMEGCYTDIVNNQVPNLWGGITGTAPNYNTVKPLASWVVDLLARMEFIIKWYRSPLLCSLALKREAQSHSLAIAGLRRARRRHFGSRASSSRKPSLQACGRTLPGSTRSVHRANPPIWSSAG